MSVRKIARLASVAVVLGLIAAPAAADDSGFAYMHDLRKESGRTCMTDHWHYGNGSGANKASAQRSAISSWQSFTDFEYGSDWARFSKAASKGISCSKGGSGIDCQVQARPCK
jgi:hypothetical protein